MKFNALLDSGMRRNDGGCRFWVDTNKHLFRHPKAMG